LDALDWEEVDGAMLDIGVSSLQLDVNERGFSLHGDAPLDMRMDMGTFVHNDRAPWTESAYTVVNQADLPTLRHLIEVYGEDPQAPRIARAIVAARQESPIETTAQLADIVSKAYPAKWRAEARNHPATRTFQAIRMVVNDELGQLERFLDQILSRLAVGGRLAIISFHSLEDRIGQTAIPYMEHGLPVSSHLPRCVCHHHAEVRLLTKKP
jgi:16S rRNA (cytosine1402-N4)-methyltransferase